MLQAVKAIIQDEAIAGPAGAVRHVLVVDDSRVQRRILTSQLTRSGLRVSEAGSGEEALACLETEDIDLVISDWVMPGLSGPELCGRLRGMSRDNYIYFILLTSKNEAAEIASGLDNGADDFLTKPVSGDELRARIAAGQRILRMERELKDNNRLLTATLKELQGLYDSLDRDLIEARKLQQSLVRERARRFGKSDVTLLLRPSGHVGGDLVGFFPINADRVGLFSIDVSGHGITSALMTARLAGYLSGSTPDHNIALIERGSGVSDVLDPHELAAELNRLVLSEIQTETYFTLCYADIDLMSGLARFVQAGHPHPAIRRRDGRVDFIGQGGLPIGLFEGAQYETCQAQLHPGDRLLIMSDGMTEVADRHGAQFGTDGLARALAAADQLRGAALFESIVATLAGYGGGDFADDVSGVLFEYDGPMEARA